MSEALPAATSRSPRHKWGPEVKSYGYTRRRCEKCGIDKMMRHSGGHHWTEGWRNGVYIADFPMPCVEPANG